MAWNSLLVSLGRGLQLQRAWRELHALRERRLDPDIEAYDGLINACGQRREAIDFLEDGVLGLRWHAMAMAPC